MNIKNMEKIAQKARRLFLPYDGVLGVGYGVKRIKESETETPAILVLVQKKLPPEQVKQGELIPKTFLGFVTDVEEVRFSRERDKADGTGLYEGKPMAQFIDWGKIHRLNLEQKKQVEKTPRNSMEKKGTTRNPPADLNTPVVEVRNNLFIIEDDGTLVYTTTNGTPVVDLVGAWNLFRATFGDDYDFVAFFLDDQDPNFPDMGNFSYSLFVNASDSGYGVSAVNNRATYGSNRLLRIVCHSWYSLRTMLHEVGHTWLFYVNYRNTPNGTEQTLLHESWDSTWNAGQKWYHPGRWPDNDRSCMDYEHLDWLEVSPGVYRSLGVADGDFNFCPLDQYLMGFLNPEAVASSRVNPPTYQAASGDFQIINNPTIRPDNDYNSTPVNINADNIIWNEGNRVPNHLQSQRVYHQAIIAITFNRTQFANFLTNAETNRQNQSSNWRRATNGRSVIDTSLLRNNIEDLYIRDNTNDTGGAFPGGSFWDSPDLFIRTHDDDPTLFLDPTVPNDTIHEKPKSNQDNWIYARIHNKSGADYENIIVNFYIANYHGFSGRDTVNEAVPRTEVIYPIDWHPDSIIGSTTLDRVPAGGTAVAKARWNQADIPAADWHPCLLTEIIPIGSTPTGLHHVWDNKKLAQKNLTIEYIPASDFEFNFPFVIGHALSPSRFAFLEIEKEVDLPNLQVYLDPKQSLGELQEVSGVLFHKIQGLDKLKAEDVSKMIETFPEVAKTGGLVVTIPRYTTLGFGYAKDLTSRESAIKVTFYDDTRLLIQSRGIDYQRLGFLPIEGFAKESSEGKTSLRMTDAKRASFPFSLAEIKDQEMNLKIHLDGRKLEHATKLHLTQRDEAGNIVGGIDLQLYPKR